MVRVKNLRKNYGSLCALDGISFEIKEGEFYGMLGPNGAGKTTTISILSTLLKADEGEVTIGGFDLNTNPAEYKKTIGVVPQEIALYNEMSAFDNLMFWGSLYKIPKRELKFRVDEVLGLFGLADRKSDLVKNYSGGMKRRINIAAALLHRPKVLFMDEPTVGIDPQSRNLIFEVVEKLHKEGMTIVYTTHYMEEAERLCERIGIIDKGRILAEGTLDELKNLSALKETLLITYATLSDAHFHKLTDSKNDIFREDNKIHFHLSHSQTELAEIVRKSGELGLDIRNIEIRKVNLESVFLNLTGKQLRD